MTAVPADPVKPVINFLALKCSPYIFGLMKIGGRYNINIDLPLFISSRNALNLSLNHSILHSGASIRSILF